MGHSEFKPPRRESLPKSKTYSEGHVRKRTKRLKGEKAPLTEAEKSQKLFSTNPFLDTFCDLIPTILPNWNSLTRELATFPIEKNYPVHRDPAALPGILAEIHVKQVITNLASSDDFNKFCEIPSLDGKRTKNYHFEEKNGRLIAIHTRTNTEKAEYDALMIINGLPTIFESKAHGDTNSPSGLRKFLSNPEQLQENYFPPLKEYFQTEEIGLVIVTVPGLIKKGSPIQFSFLKKGGKIVRMKPSLEALKKHAAGIFPLGGIIYTTSTPPQEDK